MVQGYCTIMGGGTLEIYIYMYIYIYIWQARSSPALANQRTKMGLIRVFRVNGTPPPHSPQNGKQKPVGGYTGLYRS